jgi:hypothetical protein
VWVPEFSGKAKDNVFAEKFTGRANGFEPDNVLQESRVESQKNVLEKSDFDSVSKLRRG